MLDSQGQILTLGSAICRQLPSEEETTETVQGLEVASQCQNLALTALHVPYSLDSGPAVRSASLPLVLATPPRGSLGHKQGARHAPPPAASPPNGGEGVIQSVQSFLKAFLQRKLHMKYYIVNQ